MLWDIFCRVIDNFGDIGVCWRLSADLAARGHTVRLWVDDASALAWMAPAAQTGHWLGVQVCVWDRSSHADTLRELPLADVWVESFGCDIPAPFISHFASLCGTAGGVPPAWINLEYLSAENYVERSHALPSPVMHGPASGWTKHFFYPGFTAKTGGLLREPGMDIQLLDAAQRKQFLAQHGITTDATQLVSLFCYEPALLAPVLTKFANAPEPTCLLVTHGRAAQAVRALLGSHMQQGMLLIAYLPLLSQPGFDTLLKACDLNFVRGEDSVVRAIWAGQPFVWHIYPQEDGADAPKLEAFMAQLQLDEPVRTLHRAWNGMLPVHQATDAIHALNHAARAAWRQSVLAARERLLKMDDLTTQLLQFVQKKR